VCDFACGCRCYCGCVSLCVRVWELDIHTYVCVYLIYREVCDTTRAAAKAIAAFGVCVCVCVN